MNPMSEMCGVEKTSEEGTPGITLGEMSDNKNLNGKQPALALTEGEAPSYTPRSLCSLLEDGAKADPTRAAITSLHQPWNLLPGLTKSDTPTQTKLSWSYDHLNQASDLFASCLYLNGLRRGDPIAVFLYNSAEFALSLWACAKLGAIFVPLDPRSVSNVNEVAHYLHVIRPAALMVDDKHMIDTLQQNLGQDLRKIGVILVAQQYERLPGPLWQYLGDFLANVRPLEVCASMHAILDLQKAIDVQSDIAFIIFTSGTSALPKACPHTHRNVYAAYRTGDKALPVDPSWVLVQHLPTSHIFALVGLIAFWHAGASIVFPSKTFSPATTLAAIHEEHGTHILAVPSLLTALVSHPVFDKAKLRSLQQITMGGAVISPDVIARAQASFPGAKIIVGYGMSEGTPVLLYSISDSLVFQRGYASVGRAGAGARVKICDPTTNQTTFRDETGELHIGGDMVIERYAYGDNEAFYLDRQGKEWMRTGDQASMDDSGAVYILGRYKDLIIRAGENLAPALIEASLSKVQGITVQVIGIPDEIAGELPVAVVQLHESHTSIPIEKMGETVRREIGEIYSPAYYLLLEDIGLARFPMTTSGKVQKVELTERVEEYLQKKTSQKVAPPQNDEDALCDMFAFLLGQTPESLPRKKPLQELADSINLLRLVAYVRRDLSKEISIQDVLGSTTIQHLARHLSKLEVLSHPDQSLHKYVREGPPAASEMLHTHGEEHRAESTRETTDAVLRSMGMSWENDVEDVFPVSGVALKHLANTRNYGSTIRVAFIARTADVSRLNWAIRESLRQWAIFRSISVWFDETIRLYIVLRLNSNWSRMAILEHSDVESPEDLREISLPKDAASVRAPGPLIRIIIAKVRSTNTAGVVVIANHAVHDAVSMEAWGEDLRQILSDKDARVQVRTPYKLFADTYYAHRNSLEAQLGVAYLVNKLKGLDAHKSALWPPQRCPAWFIGNDSGWQPSALEHGFGSSERKQLDEGGWRVGYDGTTQFRPLRDLAQLWTAHKISVPVVFKAACVLLNSHMTGKSTVLFANSQAGRQWPFLQDPVSRYLPNPLTIAGLTFTVLVNNITINANESVGDLLGRLEHEQQAITKYSHTPMADVLSQLPSADRGVAMEATRQLFNWQPNWRGEALRAASSELQTIQVEGHSDRGVIWHCGMLDAEKARLTVQWDGAQLEAAEMKVRAEEFLRLVEWLQKPASWGENVDKFVW